MKKEFVEVMISSDEIQNRINEIAIKIKEDLNEEAVVLVCILKGAVMFMVDLAKRLENESVEFDFMDISSYGDGTDSSGIIKVNKDLEHSIEGKNVLLVEDIIDSGRTLQHILRHLQSQKPKSLKICTLLDKPNRRIEEAKHIEVDYTGFVIPDKFVIGYGLDYQQRYRNLSYIGILSFEE